MSVYCDYENADDFPSRRRECSPLRRRTPGRIHFATKMLPASSWTKGEKRLQDDGVARLVAGLPAVAEDDHRPIQILKYSLP